MSYLVEYGPHIRFYGSIVLGFVITLTAMAICIFASIFWGVVLLCVMLALKILVRWLYERYNLVAWEKYAPYGKSIPPTLVTTYASERDRIVVMAFFLALAMGLLFGRYTVVAVGVAIGVSIMILSLPLMWRAHRGLLKPRVGKMF